MSIANNLQNLASKLPKQITLVAVSKTKPVSDIMEAYNAGQRVFGENKIQEMVGKHEQLPKDIQWHMIGHLQRNKVKYMAPFVKLIHGVDSLKTLKEINKQAKKHERTIECLLQVKIAEEETKFGLSVNDATLILESEELKEFSNVIVVGLMGMASLTDNTTQIRKEFKLLKSTFDTLSANNQQLTTLSMGMSGDYNIAIQEGSTMIRVGSCLLYTSPSPRD